MAQSKPVQTARIRPVWRALLACLAIILAGVTVIGEQAGLGIRGYYFKDFSPWVPSISDALAAVVVLYLLLVAATGRWRLVSR